MNGEKISVIVPVYNAEKYIEACVFSILNQTYQNFELILVDDGSKDESLKICKSIADNNSKIQVIHQENMGVSCARNKGIELSTGDYITFVDSDDELTENALQILFDDAKKYDADIVSAVKCHINADGTVSNPYEDLKTHIYKGKEMVCLSLEGDRQTNSACAKLFKKDFLGNIRFVPDRKINEDGFFLFECYVKQPVNVQHNICIYKYFIRTQSASRGSFSEKYFDIIYFCQEKKKIIEKLYPEFFDKMRDQEVTSHIFFLEALCRTKDKKYKPFQKESVKLVKDNYKFYGCENAHEKQMAKIIKLGFFPVYKFLIYNKYYR